MAERPTSRPRRPSRGRTVGLAALATACLGATLAAAAPNSIVRLAVNNQKFLEACTPGYYNNEGKPGDRSVRNGSYGNGAIEFIEVLDAWRAAGTLDGLELTR